MKSICRDVRNRLAAEGPTALREDTAAQQHLEECGECFEVLEALGRLDQGLGVLSDLDAPEALVTSVIARVRAQPTPEPGADKRPLMSDGSKRLLLWGGASAAAAALMAVITTPSLLRTPAMAPAELRSEYIPEHGAPPPLASALPERRSGAAPTPADEREKSRELVEGDRLDDDVNSPEFRARRQALAEQGATDSFALNSPLPESVESKLRGAKRAEAPSSGLAVGQDKEKEAERLAALGYLGSDQEGAGEVDLHADIAETNEATFSGRRYYEEGVVRGVEGGVPGGVVGGTVRGTTGDEGVPSSAKTGNVGAGPRLSGERLPPRVHYVKPDFPTAARQAGVRFHVELELGIDEQGRVRSVRPTGETMSGRWNGTVDELVSAIVDAARQWRFAPAFVEGRPIPAVLVLELDYDLGDRSSSSTPTAPISAADAFLSERDRVEGLRFQHARGYWANTWVPGDPRLRVLQARLAGGVAALQGLSSAPVRLHEAARVVAQPFDAPQDAAVRLFAQTDRAAVDGESRLLLQVGLQAIERAGGRRPALDLSVVLDLRSHPPTEVAASMRVLSLAFARARRSGDRFRLIAAGAPGGLLVEPEAFRHGPVAVGFDRALAAAESGDPFDLPAALGLALEAAAAHGEAASGAVVLVTPAAIGASLDELADLAHQGAVAGIPTSVVGIGAGAVPAEMDRLALSGQGHRRILAARDEAPALVERELASASRAVARALRLRIRLAPGVRLVGIVGSHSLSEHQAERVREAERSLDLRLARDLGLEADRGEDEDGIQIVIPSFQSGASHAILLDLVAPGPGAVADVTLLYKDVVFLRNGVARAGVSLPRGRRPAGPLELGVIKTLLAQRLAGDLAAGAEAVASGRMDLALTCLRGTAELRAGLGARLPGFAGDRELAADAAMLAEYVQLLDHGAGQDPHARRQLSDSLRFAGRLKLLPRPAPLVAEGS